MSIVPTGEILRIAFQTGERVDTGGPGVDLLPESPQERYLQTWILYSESEIKGGEFITPPADYILP